MQLTARLALQYLAIGLAGGAAVGLGNYLVEQTGFSVCHLLAHYGLVTRLSKAGAAELDDHPLSNIMTVSVPYVPLYWLLARCWSGPGGFGEKMQLHIDPIYTLCFMW